MDKKVRVRFAPSPTGGLHLGGMRTVLYNYLFAKKHQGDFILRIEDTDQSRFVEGAEQYIFDCLSWAGLEPDESPVHGGTFGPYRQSERKSIYRKYAEQLVNEDHAYYAFDTPDELDEMRRIFRSEKNPSPQYDRTVRNKMTNSLTLGEEEVRRLLGEELPFVIRIKMPENETTAFTDMIRGEVHFNTSLIDDKVLLKADGMPTYHLAMVVDDYLMKITHVFRGEEWLPSAPVHILLWKYLFGLTEMPQWAHLPLILGPEGKLSKRDGARYGFPVFGMHWKDPLTGEEVDGFREKGFLPEAFINFLAMLGWNDGTEQEIFSKEELINKFSVDRVHSGGAKFDYEKAKWFNHEWIKRSGAERLKKEVKSHLEKKNLVIGDEAFLEKVIELVKDRCTLLSDFYDQSCFLFQAPGTWDMDSMKSKWDDSKKLFFAEVIRNFELNRDWNAVTLEKNFKEIASINKIKPGEVLFILRIMLVGGKFGPGVFDIVALLGKTETIQRIKTAMAFFN